MEGPKRPTHACMAAPVLFSGMRGGHPLGPNAYSGATRNRDSSPRRIVATANSNPGRKPPVGHQEYISWNVLDNGSMYKEIIRDAE